MIAAQGLKVVAKPRREFPPAVLSLIERKAYRAAWRILQMTTDVGHKQLVCPGAQRSRRVDMIAEAIMKEFEPTPRKHARR